MSYRLIVYNYNHLFGQIPCIIYMGMYRLLLKLARFGPIY